MEKNSQVVERFLAELRAQQKSEKSIENYAWILQKLDAFLGKPFREATREDMVRFFSECERQYAEPTVNLLKTCTKRFYRWLYNMEDGYPECVKWVKPKPTANRLPRDSLLTEDEVMRMARATKNQRDRAIIMVLWESAARAGELMRARVGDVQQTEYGASIKLSGKTGDRVIPLVLSAPDLMLWLNQHPRREDPNAPLWFGFTWKDKDRLTINRLWELLRQAAKSAGINKKVHPHLFRHSRLTQLAKELPEQVLKRFAGWTPSSAMAEVYVKLSCADVSEALLSKVYGIKKEEAEEKKEKVRPKECKRCTFVNPPDALWCCRCGAPLSLEVALKAEEAEKKGIDEKVDVLLAKVLQMPEVAALIKQKLVEVLAAGEEKTNSPVPNKGG